MPLVGPLSASDGNPVIQVSGSIEVLEGETIKVHGGGDPGLYTAGDGLDLSGTAFSTDLKSGGGLKIDTTELAVEPADFAGTGLEDDGSDNLRISTAAAGDGLTGGGGSALAADLKTAGGLKIDSTELAIDHDIIPYLTGAIFSGDVGVTGSLEVTGALISDHISGSITTLNDGRPLLLPGNADIAITSGSGDQITITVNNTTYTAGDGLDLSGTTFLVDLKSSGGLKIDSTELAVEPSDFAGTGLQDDGSDNLRISTTAAGTGLQGGGGSALSVGAGIGINVAASAVGIDNTVVATLSGSQFSGNVGVTGSISASGQLSGSNLFADVLSGSLTTLTDGRPYILGGTAITITSGAYIPGAGGATPEQITIASSDTTYTAGDGLDLAGTVFKTDLKSAGGLHIDSTELAVDHDVIPYLTGAIFSGPVGVTGSLTSTGRIVSSNGTSEFSRIDVGGGYGSTGTTLFANGDVSMDGDLISDNITVGDGNFYAAAGQTLALNSPHHVIVKLDTDNNGTASFQIDNGAGTEILNVDESGNLQTDGNITVGGNIIKASDGGSTITMDTSDNVTVGGNLIVGGNEINSSGGDTAITFEEAEGGLHTMDIDVDLKVSGNNIKDSGSNTQISFTAGSKTTFPKSVDVTGNITGSNLWLDNDGTTEDVVLKIGDGTPYLGIQQLSDKYLFLVAGTGYASRPIQIGRDDGNHTVTISADEADVQGNLTISGELDVQGDAIKDSGGSDAITFDGSSNVLTKGNLTVFGNSIKDSGGNSIFTFDGSGYIVNDINLKSVSSVDRPILTLESIDSSADDSAELAFYKYDNVFGAGSSLGEIKFYGGESLGTYYIGSEIRGEVGTGTWTDTSSQPGRLSFWTVPDGSTTITEQMVIDSDGLVTLTGDLEVEGDFGDITSSGDLTITPGGDLKITPTGGQVMIDGDLYLYGDDGYTNLTCQIYDSTNAGVLLLKDSNVTKVQLNSLANGDSYFNSGGALCVGATAASAPIQFYVLESSTASTSYIAHIRNSGNGSNADCLRLDIAYTSNPTTTNNYIRMYFSASTAAGKITGDGAGGVSYVDAFTGTHPSVTSDSTASLIIGMIVSSTGEIWAKNIETVSTGIPKTTLSNTDNDKTVFGILAEIGKDANGEYCYEGYVESWGLKAGEEALVVNSIGEGLVWITNINGNIENGDYITTSTIAGYGRLQDDDLLHGYTVAKCTETVDWNSVTDTIEHEGQTYKKFLVSCTYHCG